RTFVSMLERGTTSPTLEKLDSLCTVLDIRPVTLLALTYVLGSETPESFEQLLEKVGEELRALVEPD
ncbi:TPA: XRE family transcriptional regulator, partial [Pseudomonas aeruginosa]